VTVGADRATTNRSDLLERWLRERDRASEVRIPRRPPAGEPPASFAQQRLWLIDQLVSGNVAYNIHEAFRLRGPLDVDALRWSIDRIVQRHETLRTTFGLEGEDVVQRIVPPAPVELAVVDLSREPAREEQMRRLAVAEARTPFDLAAGPLFRAQLLRLAPDDHVLLTTTHHTVGDGWSLQIFNRELGELYEARTTGRAPELPELPIQYADYAVWQRGELQGEVLEQQLAYWKERLRDLPAAIDLPSDRQRPSVQSLDGARLWFHVDEHVAGRVKELVREERVTLFTVLFAAYATLLHRYTGEAEIVVGTPVAGRERPELEPLIGCFVNTLVFRTDCSGDPTFRELVRRVRETAQGAYAHQQVPFERLVEELQPERNLSHSPLFQVLFALQLPDYETLALPGIETEVLEIDNGTAAFDLVVSLEERAEGFAGWLTYSTALFEEATVRRLVRHLETLLEDAASRPDTRLGELELLPPEERETLLRTWNRTEAPYPREKLIQDLVDEQASRTPDKDAVVAPNGGMTFAELVSKSNRLARFLRRQGVGPEVPVALLTERTLDMAIAQLAVLKAGGAYVPLDPQFPPDRLDFILRDTGAPLVLAESTVLDKLPELDGEVIVLDRSWEEIDLEPDEPLPSAVTVSNLAQVYYTSGSTGQPKGVLVTHEGWSNIITWHGRYFGLTPEDRAAQFGAVAFDACAWELWTNLAAGASVHLMDDETRMSPERALEWMAANGITVTWMPAVLAEAVLALPFPPGLRLRWLASGGDRLHVRPREPLPFTFYNMYGPTEITIMRTCDPVGPTGRSLPPIGHPIANTELYVLDALGNPVPIGLPGELYIGGPGLARGYLGRPARTAEKFVPNPFSSEPGSRLYRTGDVVRVCPDGAVDFIGRSDDQVKIRGFRVELGEIETVLEEHPEVADACVVLRADRSRLDAYVVANGSEPTPRELSDHVAKKLPEYMVPGTFVFLDELPLNAFGKVDRLALPEPEVAHAASLDDAPRTEAEQILCRIWQDVLGLEAVGIHDNFFKLGGSSLLATKAVAQVREAFDRKVPLRRLFEDGTVAGMAAWLEAEATRA